MLDDVERGDVRKARLAAHRRGLRCDGHPLGDQQADGGPSPGCGAANDRRTRCTISADKLRSLSRAASLTRECRGATGRRTVDEEDDNWRSPRAMRTATTLYPVDNDARDKFKVQECIENQSEGIR